MSNIFWQILNMSLSASWLILAVIVFRLVFSRSPKWLRTVMWALVAVRLAVPFSIESILSLVPKQTPILNDTQLYINTGSQQLTYTNPSMSVTYTEQTGMLNITNIVSAVWMSGVAILLIYMLISYILLRKRVNESIEISKNIRICDRIESPFILGIIRPTIYLNSCIEESDRKYVISHERAHLKRLDNIWKPLGFILLCVHWFNPLCWMAYILFNKDIELACDERVVREYDANDKKAYASALLSCSMHQTKITACPLAFAEVSVKQRVKNILKYKKCGAVIMCAAVIACVAVFVCFMTEPVSAGEIDINRQITDAVKVVSTVPTTEPTTVPTEPATEAPTEKATEKPTDPPTEPPTEVSYEEPDYYDKYSYNEYDYYEESYEEPQNNSIVSITPFEIDNSYNEQASRAYKEVLDSIGRRDITAGVISDKSKYSSVPNDFKIKWDLTPEDLR